MPPSASPVRTLGECATPPTPQQQLASKALLFFVSGVGRTPLFAGSRARLRTLHNSLVHPARSEEEPTSSSVGVSACALSATRDQVRKEEKPPQSRPGIAR